MTKLFIIGNGFDLAHKMNTRYSDFRKFLINKGKEHDNFKEDIYYDEIPAPTLTSDGEGVYNPADRLNAILTCIDNTNGDIEWNKFEESLGKLNYECLLNPYLEDKDEKLSYKVERNENNARNIKNVLGFSNKSRIRFVFNFQLYRYIGKIVQCKKCLSYSWE